MDPNLIVKPPPFKVMMIGPGLQGKGGISSVIKGYFETGIASRLKIDHIRTFRQGSKPAEICYFLRKLLHVIVNIPKYDILHIHTASRWSFRRKLVLVILGKCLFKKVILHLHGGRFDIYYQESNAIEKGLIRFIYGSCDQIVVLSQEWREKVSLFCDAKKIEIIPNCVSVAPLVSNREKGKRKNILFLGELTQKKGVYDLLNAISYAKFQPGKVVFSLYGNGEINRVKEKSKELGLCELVRVPGWISGQEKQAILSQGYLFVLPSYIEGLPVSILEALARGIPVISTPVGGIPTAIEDGVNGLLVPVSDPQALGDAIKRIVQDEDLRGRLSVNAHLTAEKKFSMRLLERKLLRTYQKVYDA